MLTLPDGVRKSHKLKAHFVEGDRFLLPRLCLRGACELPFQTVGHKLPSNKWLHSSPNW